MKMSHELRHLMLTWNNPQTTAENEKSKNSRDCYWHRSPVDFAVDFVIDFIADVGGGRGKNPTPHKSRVEYSRRLL